MCCSSLAHQEAHVPTVSPYPHQITTSIHSSSSAERNQQAGQPPASSSPSKLPCSSLYPAPIAHLLLPHYCPALLLRLGFGQQQRAVAPGLTHMMDGSEPVTTGRDCAHDGSGNPQVRA
jgi:hypothetical protein